LLFLLLLGPSLSPLNVDFFHHILVRRVAGVDFSPPAARRGRISCVHFVAALFKGADDWLCVFVNFVSLQIPRTALVPGHRKLARRNSHFLAAFVHNLVLRLHGNQLEQVELHIVGELDLYGLSVGLMPQQIEGLTGHLYQVAPL